MRKKTWNLQEPSCSGIRVQRLDLYTRQRRINRDGRRVGMDVIIH